MKVPLLHKPKRQWQKRRGQIIQLFAIVFLLTGCTESYPESKDAYLNEFEMFSQLVLEKCPEMKSDQFDELAQRYIRLSRDWYEKYYDQLSRDEINRIWVYKAQFIGCRLKANIRNSSKSIYQELEKTILGI